MSDKLKFVGHSFVAMFSPPLSYKDKDSHDRDDEQYAHQDENER
jgi:hypothetical protein